MQNLGWAEIQIVAVLLVMVALPVGIVVYLVRLAQQMREEHAQLSKRIANLEAARDAATAAPERRAGEPAGLE
jgi:TRAP-type C4-dicarboxylate transport system permease small subunit